jgi:hypothetical protein
VRRLGVGTVHLGVTSTDANAQHKTRPPHPGKPKEREAQKSEKKGEKERQRKAEQKTNRRPKRGKRKENDQKGKRKMAVKTLLFHCIVNFVDNSGENRRRRIGQERGSFLVMMKEI